MEENEDILVSQGSIKFFFGTFNDLNPELFYPGKAKKKLHVRYY